MRVVKDNLPLVDVDAGTPLPVEVPEYICTCPVCLSSIGFRQTDPEVATTNELEFVLNCPACESALLVEKTTGVVIAR